MVKNEFGFNKRKRTKIKTTSHRIYKENIYETLTHWKTQKSLDFIRNNKEGPTYNRTDRL